MNRININAILLLILICGSLYPQPDTLWTRTYGGDGSEIGLSVIETTNRDIVFTGFTDSYGSGGRDVLIGKYDSSGNLTWSRTIGNNLFQEGMDIVETDDNGYAIIGYTINNADDLWLVKTDSNGDTLWTKTYGGSDIDKGSSLYLTHDNGFILSGYTKSYGNGNYDVWLLRTNSLGDTLWTKTFGGGVNDMGYDVIETTDLGFLVVCYTASFGEGSADLWLIKTDSNGTMEWDKTYGGGGFDACYSVQQTSDNGFILTGVTDSFGDGSNDLWLIKTNSSGDTLWTKTYGGINTDVGRSIAITDDDGFIISGYKTHYSGNDDIWLIKTDSNGDSLWTKTIGGNYDDVARCIIRSVNKGYIITGYTHSYGNGQNDVWIIRLANNTGPVWYVSTTGSDSTGDGSEEYPFATIQYGIDISNDGDTVLVQPGTYFENINFNGKNIVVGSLILTTGDTSYISQTVIDGNQSGSVISFQSGSDSSFLKGFTIQNGLRDFGGGGIYIISSSPIISDCIITNNQATDKGGGIYSSVSNYQLISCTVLNNNAPTGAGLYIYRSNALIEDVEIYSNSASDYGGGIVIEESTPNINYSIIRNNNASINGGGIEIWFIGTNPTIYNSKILDNTAGSRGGGIYFRDNAAGLVKNTVIARNSSDWGAGIYTYNATPNLENVTIAANQSSYNGSELYMHASSVNLINSIIWESGPYDPLKFYDNVQLSTTYSNFSYTVNGTGNTSNDPFFSDSDYHLQVGSPCIDAGDPAYNYSNEPEPNGNRINMGAYGNTEEATITIPSYNGPIWHISTNGSDVGNGSEIYPFATIQHGIDAASDGDTVLVQSGTYIENINFNGKDIVVISTEGAESTIIDGNQSGSVVTINVPTYCTLDGFTLQNGQNENGGGINFNFEPGGWVHLKNLIIQNNVATGKGGGVYHYSAGSELHNVIVRNNIAPQGGGINLEFEGSWIYNSLIYGNEGEGVRLYYSTSKWYNTTISENGGYGVLSYNAQPRFYNSIMYGNINDGVSMNGSLSAFYCDIENGQGEWYFQTGCIDTNPNFTDPDNGDFHLQATSPCIDAGDPDLDNDGYTWENDLDDRDPDGTRMDMGAYYYHQTPYYGPVWHISTVGSDETGNGSEENPFATIQYGIDISNDGDTILIADGEYVENIIIDRKSLVISAVSEDGVLINGNNQSNVIRIDTCQTVVLEGLHILNGLAETVPHNLGGGILINYSNVTINDCEIESCISEYGGGVAAKYSSLIMTDCTVRMNSSEWEGGGIFVSWSNALINSCKISNNTVVGTYGGNNGGGGIFAFNSGVTIEYSVITNNIENQNFGGGFYIRSSGGTSSYSISNSTFYDNTASHQGGAIYSGSILSGTIVNTICWNDTSLDNSWNEISSPEENINLTFSDIEGGYPYSGEGVINSDPLFINPELNNYYLQWGSPCIDSGNPDLDDDGITWQTDPDDQDPDGTRLDMGAYYFDQSTVNIVTITPDSLDFETDLDTLPLLINYVGINDLTWSITNAPDWLSFDPSQSGSRSDYRNNGTLPHSVEFMPSGKPNSLTPSITYSIRSNLNRSTSDTVLVIVDRDLLEVGITEDQFIISSDYSDDTVHVTVEKLYQGPAWYVSLGGNDFTGDGSSDSPFRHIQWAVDKADSGDTIFVNPGTYQENILISNKELVLIGIDGEQLTIIDGQNIGNALSISNAAFSEIYGFKIINSPIGLECQLSDSIKLGNLTIEGNVTGIQFSECISAILTDIVCNDNSEKGMNIFATDVMITDASITNNQCGIRFDTDAGNDLTLLRVNITDNVKDGWGAGFYIGQSSDGTVVFIDSCNFSNNISTNEAGGAIMSLSTNASDSIIVRNTIFRNNHAYNGGSAIWANSISTNVVLSNSSFFSNSSNYALIRTDANITIFDCLFVNNDGPLFSGTGSPENHFSIRNSIIWNNSVTDTYWPVDSILITYSCIEEGWPGVGNISEDPEFCDVYAGDFRLANYSPCIGSGWNNENMGGLEVGCTVSNSRIYVSVNGNDSLGTGTENEPFQTIQHSVNTIWSNDSLVILPGTFYENINIPQDNFTIGSLFMIDGDTSNITNTVLDGSANGRVMSVTTDQVKIIGLTINNGLVVGKGGGINITGSRSFISNCIFENNHTDTGTGGWGGGMYMRGGVINHCVFKNNSAGEGGGLAIQNDTTFISNCVFYNNISNDQNDDIMIIDSGTEVFIDSTSFKGSPNNSISDYFGANLTINHSMFDSCIQAIYMDAGNLNIQNSIFQSSVNSAIYADEGNVVISHTMFKNNYSESGGALNFGYGVDATISHSQFLNNGAQTGGAISGYLTSGHAISIINCSFFGNFALSGRDIYIGEYAQCTIKNSILYNTQYEVLGGDGNWQDNYTVTYSLIHNFDGTGNFSQDPLFVDPSNGDLHLQSGSPAIDAGDPLSPLDPDSTRADMGALYFDQSDEIPPSVEILTPTAGAQYGTEDTISIRWSAYDNIALAWARIFYSPINYYEDQFELIDSVDANTGSYEFEVPDSVVSSTSRLIVIVSDNKNNTSADTSGYFSIFDNTDPEVTILAPTEGFSIPEYENISVEWLATDNLEIDSIDIYYSVKSGQTPLCIKRLPGDLTSFTFSIPAGVTDSATTYLVATDIYGNTGSGFSDLFTVTDNTPPTVSLLTPVSGSQFSIGSTTKISWAADDNVFVTAIDLLYSINNGNSWIEIAAGESNDGSYDWLIPNEPSDQVGLRLIAEDAVALKDTVEVMGMSIKIEYPTVFNVTPTPSTQISWLGRDRDVFIQFSQPIFEPINNDSILINTASGVVIDSFLTATVTDSILSISVESGFPSNDTITIELMSNEFTNIYGYRLDGNGDGIPGDNYVINYTTTMLADYDTSSTIDLLDLAQFVQALEEDNYYYELGPVTGTVPHFFSYVDSTFNIEDVMAFVMMWNWYATTNESMFTLWQNIGHPIEIETTPDSIFIEIPNKALAYEVQIKYDPKNLMIGDPQIDADIKLKDIDTEGGFFTFLSVPEEYNKIPIPIQITEKKADITISIRVAGYDGEIISQLTKDIHLANVPKQFTLHQNYPNPFNPITNIDYDLPFDTYVELIVYDLLGREVITLVKGVKKAGYHSVKWSGSDDIGKSVSAGIYFTRIQAGNFSQTRKLLLIK